MEAKEQVRAAVIARRSTVTAQERARNDAVICGGVAGLLWHEAARRGWQPQPGGVPPITVCGFVPVGTEAGGPQLPEAIAGACQRLLLPVSLAAGVIDWAEYTGLDSLQRGRFGIPEPSGERLGSEAVTTADVILVPAVALDERGNRLGRGGGYYDRALSLAHPNARIACVLDSADVLDTVPVEEHDQAVDVVITEAGLRWFSSDPAEA